MSEKNEWKPIESAPKDELILVGPTKRMGICVAMNHSRDGWVTETCNEWFSIYTPTHWMPLPAAPGSTPSAPGDAQDERQAFEAEYVDHHGMRLEDYDFEFFTASNRYHDDHVQSAWWAWQIRARMAAPAAGDALDAPVPEWASCESRGPWVTNSLKANAQELRDKEKRCRRAFNKDFMGVPSRYVANAYAEAAAVFEAKLAALAAQVPNQDKGDA